MMPVKSLTYFVLYFFSIFATTIAAEKPDYEHVRQISTGGGVDFTIYGKVKKTTKKITDSSLYLNSKTRMVKHQHVAKSMEPKI